MELHPMILKKHGKPQFAVLPYEEFLFVQNQLGANTEGGAVSDPKYGGFTDNLSADELAARQGIAPANDIASLYGKGDPDDWAGFDETLELWRTESGVV